jgi:hypothetical protein
MENRSAITRVDRVGPVTYRVRFLRHNGTPYPVDTSMTYWVAFIFEK